MRVTTQLEGAGAERLKQSADTAASLQAQLTEATADLAAATSELTVLRREVAEGQAQSASLKTAYVYPTRYS